MVVKTRKGKQKGSEGFVRFESPLPSVVSASSDDFGFRPALHSPTYPSSLASIQSSNTILSLTFRTPFCPPSHTTRIPSLAPLA